MVIFTCLFFQLNCMGFKKWLLIALIALNVSLIPGSLIAGAQFLPLPEDKYTNFFPNVKGDTALAKTSFLAKKIVNGVRIAIGAVAVLLIITAALQVVVGQGKEESYDKAKTIIIYSVIGLAIIAISGDLSKIVDLTGGGLLGNKEVVLSRVRLFDNSIRIIITFFKYFIGAIAIFMLVRSGFRMVALGHNEEELGNDKKNIAWISIGLVALVFMDNFVKNVFYKIDNPFETPTLDVGQGIKEIVSFTNLVVGFVGPIAILSLVAGGVMYVASGGNDDTQGKAKKLMATSLVGIIIIYGAFGIVSTIISGAF